MQHEAHTRQRAYNLPDFLHMFTTGKYGQAVAGNTCNLDTYTHGTWHQLLKFAAIPMNQSIIYSRVQFCFQQWSHLHISSNTKYQHEKNPFLKKNKTKTLLLHQFSQYWFKSFWQKFLPDFGKLQTWPFTATCRFPVEKGTSYTINLDHAQHR